MSDVRTGRRRSRIRSFIGDQRGTAAFEMAMVYTLLVFSLLLPLADLAIAGFKFISAYQALRDMGQRTQYSPPADVTDGTVITAWKAALPSAISGYTVTPEIYCGSPGTVAPCASGAASPRWTSLQQRRFAATTASPRCCTGVTDSPQCASALHVVHLELDARGGRHHRSGVS